MVTTAYDSKGSQEYDEKRFTSPQGKLFNALEMEQLRRVADRLSVPSNILEVGCGTGRFVAYLSGVGHYVRGLDSSPHMLAIVKRKLAQCKAVEFDLGEGACLPYAGNQFDFVYSIRTVNQTASREYALRMIREMIRVVHPGGVVLIEFTNNLRPHRKGYGGVRLSVLDIGRIAKENANLKVLGTGGVLFFSQMVLERVPSWLLPLFGRVDRFCCRLLPQFAARCYVTLIKGEGLV